jgi:hypothetical protein
MAAVPVLTLTNPSPAYGDYFGDSVAISGTRLVIGVLFADIGAIDSGAAYVYDLTSFTPAVPVAMFTNPTPGLYDEFGDWVAIDGSNIIVGAHSDDTGAFDRGAAYVFSLVPALSITPVAPDSVTISWAPSSTSFMLQCSDSLMDTNWSNAPSGSINPVTIPIAAQSRFYRLIRN